MQNDTSEINDLVTKAAEEKAKQDEAAKAADTTKIDDKIDDKADDKKSDAIVDDKKDDKPDAEKEAKAKEEKIAAEVRASLLKELGGEDIDDLKAKLAASGGKKLTKEEEEKAQAIYEANLQKFAVEEGDMKLEEFTQLSTLKSKQDADLVFEGFLKDFVDENGKRIKEENKEAGLSASEIEEEVKKQAKEEFESEYKLNSESEKQKAKGVSRLAKEAAELRSPIEKKYSQTKEKFDAASDLRTEFPKFAKTIESTTSSLIPEKIPYFKGKDGETDIAIEIELTPEERKEIKEAVIKKVQNPDNYFELYKPGKPDDLKNLIAEQVDYLVEKKVREKGNSKIAEIFHGLGVKKGSTVGAENSFAVNQSKGAAHKEDKVTVQQNEKIVLDQFGK